jgi:hypothetical protein
MMIAQTQDEHATRIPAAATVDLKLEVVVLSVSDIDRAKRFYQNLGWQSRRAADTSRLTVLDPSPTKKSRQPGPAQCGNLADRF